MDVWASDQLPRVRAPGASVSGFISVWTQDCSDGCCGLPQGVLPAKEVAFDMVLPDQPGYTQVKKVWESFTVEGLGELKVRLSFYSVCPLGAAEGCPSRYFQTQAELSGAVRAFCAVSLNAADFLPFPVFMCAGILPSGSRLGITLSRSIGHGIGAGAQGINLEPGLPNQKGGALYRGEF